MIRLHWLNAAATVVAATTRTSLQVIFEAIEAYKADHKDQLPPNIICTGHSLGGALATLAAAHIAIRYPDYQATAEEYTERRLQVYTFAAPRVGDDVLHDYFKDKLQLTAVQVKNTLDVVPDVAPGEIVLCTSKKCFHAVV
jgi:triacylglycerol lipase